MTFEDGPYHIVAESCRHLLKSSIVKVVLAPIIAIDVKKHVHRHTLISSFGSAALWRNINPYSAISSWAAFVDDSARVFSTRKTTMPYLAYVTYIPKLLVITNIASLQSMVYTDNQKKKNNTVASSLSLSRHIYTHAYTNAYRIESVNKWLYLTFTVG